MGTSSLWKSKARTCLEKKNIGELWEAKSEGKALYLMAVKPDGNGEAYRQVEENIK